MSLDCILTNHRDLLTLDAFANCASVSVGLAIGVTLTGWFQHEEKQRPRRYHCPMRTATNHIKNNCTCKVILSNCSWQITKKFVQWGGQSFQCLALAIVNVIPNFLYIQAIAFIVFIVYLKNITLLYLWNYSAINLCIERWPFCYRTVALIQLFSQ